MVVYCHFITLSDQELVTITAVASIFIIFNYPFFAIFDFTIIFQKTNVAVTQGQTDFCEAEICYALGFTLKEVSEEQDHNHQLLRGHDKYLQCLNLA